MGYDFLGKVIGGPGHGDGLLGPVMHLFSGLAILGGGGAAMFGGTEMGAGEAMGGVFTDVGGMAAHGKGIMAGLFEMMGSTDWVMDYYILNGGFGGKGKFRDFSGMGAETQEKAKIITEATASHGFFLTMLEEHKDKPGVEALYNEYKALGLNLPSKELADKVHHKLLGYLHPDKNPSIPEELIKALNTGRDNFKNDVARSAYEAELHNDRSGIEKIFDTILKKKTKWKEFYENAARAAETSAPSSGTRLAIAASEIDAGAGAKNWFSKLHSAGQAGVVFAGVAVAALGVYWVAHSLESRRKKHITSQMNPSLSHAERMQAASTGADTTRSVNSR